jgi:aromatic ring-opening dioxygenase LigB subunit
MHKVGKTAFPHCNNCLAKESLKEHHLQYKMLQGASLRREKKKISVLISGDQAHL